jgi:hypothetical protein
VLLVSCWHLPACGDDDQPGFDSGPDSQTTDAGADAGESPLSMALGELHDVEPDASGLAQVTLATPSGDEEFLLMLQSRATALRRLEAFTIGVTPSSLPQLGLAPPPRLPQARFLSRQELEMAEPPAGSLGAPVRCGFDHQALADLRERLAGHPAPRGMAPPPPPAPPPDPGDTVQFQIDATSGLVTIDASVLHVSSSLVVCLDKTTDPSLELEPTLLQEISDGFEDIALPRLRDFFGQESDVNSDGHVTLLFSPLVADLATAYVNPYDLVTDPELRPAGVAANDQELIYITPPQLLDPHMATARAILETVSHEFQHAIYFYRKYLLNDQLGGIESIYVTEGLSGLAQDLSGYHAGIFFINKSALDSWDLMSVNDLVRSGGAYFSDRPELYGGAYLLMRYLFDQAGGETLLQDGMVDLSGSPGASWLRSLVDSPLLGEASIEAASGQAVSSVATDWFTALMVDDRLDADSVPLNTDPRYNFLPPTVDPLTGRQRGTTMFESFMGMVTKTGPIVREAISADGVIRAGGAEYLRFAASSPGTITLQVQADPERVDPLLRIFRLR